MKKLLFFPLYIILLQCTIAQNTWTQKTDFGGTARGAAVGFSIGTKGYIGTGVDNLSTFAGIKDFWEYNQATNTWSQKADFGGIGRAVAVGFSIGTKGYIGTGKDIFSTGILLKDFWEYDPSLNTWVRKTDFPGTARRDAVGFSIGTKGYIGTGRDNSTIGETKDFWEYDPSLDTWTRKADFGGDTREQAAGFSIGSKGYLGTGFDTLQRSSTNNFWEYDPALNSWTRKADFGGLARNGAAAFSIASKGYIGLGGLNIDDSVSKDFWEYDPATNIWTRKADFGGIARGYTGPGFAIGSKGYIGTGYSGGDNASGTLFKDFWEYAPPINYRTRQSGNWNDINTWEISLDNSTWNTAISTPDFNINSTTIRSTHTVTVTANVIAAHVFVNPGGALITGTGITLTVK